MSRPTPIQDAIRARLVERAVAQGAPRELAERTLRQLERERPLLDWLAAGGFEALVRLFLELLPLFLSEPPAES